MKSKKPSDEGQIWIDNLGNAVRIRRPGAMPERVHIEHKDPKWESMKRLDRAFELAWEQTTGPQRVIASPATDETPPTKVSHSLANAGLPVDRPPKFPTFHSGDVGTGNINAPTDEGSPKQHRPNGTSRTPQMHPFKGLGVDVQPTLKTPSPYAPSRSTFPVPAGRSPELEEALRNTQFGEENSPVVAQAQSAERDPPLVGGRSAPFTPLGERRSFFSDVDERTGGSSFSSLEGWGWSLRREMPDSTMRSLRNWEGTFLHLYRESLEFDDPSTSQELAREYGALLGSYYATYNTGFASDGYIDQIYNSLSFLDQPDFLSSFVSSVHSSDPLRAAVEDSLADGGVPLTNSILYQFHRDGISTFDSPRAPSTKSQWKSEGGWTEFQGKALRRLEREGVPIASPNPASKGTSKPTAEHTQALLKRLRKAKGTLAISRGEVSAQDLAALHRATDHEMVIYRDRSTGQLYLSELGMISGKIPEGSRLIIHTHAGTESMSVTPSDLDRDALVKFDQFSSIIVSEDYTYTIRFRRDGTRDEPRKDLRESGLDKKHGN